MIYGKRPTRCHNCGQWIVKAYANQTVCCLDYDGPRWIEDKQAAEDYKVYMEWFDRLPERETR
jgi:hypothetical protein